MAKVLTNGILTHYQVKGSGPDVVLVHGVTSSLAQWYIEMLPRLTPDYRVTIYDLRGHGLSEMPEHGYDSETMARDLLGLMDHVGIESAVLVGHSYGGAIGLHLSLLQPHRVRGVVLLDTGLACLRYLRVISDWEGWDEYGSRLAEFGITREWFMDLDQNQDAAEIIKRSLSVPMQNGFRKGQQGMTPRLERLLSQTRIGFEFREVGNLTEEGLKRVQVPVLAVYGETSPYVKMAQRVHELVPECRFDVIPEAGHFSVSSDPVLNLERMRGFLKDPKAWVMEGRLASPHELDQIQY